MGRKGKKKGGEGESSGQGGQAPPAQRSEQPRPQPQPQQQQQQGGQRGGQQQQGGPPGGQQPQGAWGARPQPSQQQQQQPPQQQHGGPRGGQQQQGGAGPPSQPRGQQSQAPQGAWGGRAQQPQQQGDSSGLAAPMQRMSTQDDGRGRGRGAGRGAGRGDGRDHGRQDRRPGPPQQSEPPRRIPGMAEPQQGQRRPPQAPQAPPPTATAAQQPQRSPSVASSGGGDAASVRSSGSGPTQKPSPKSGTPGGLDKKLLTTQQKNTCLSMIPKRKNPSRGGTQGRPIQVFTNMISIIFDSNFKLSATHYDVKFDPDKPKFLKKLAFEVLRKQYFPRNWPAFDGKVNAYSAGDLPFGHSLCQEVTVFDEERQQERPVKVTMEKVNTIDISWLKQVRPGIDETERDQTTMQVLDVILRSAPYTTSITVGRSFFQRPRNNGFDLSGGMELWVGIFQSAVLGWKPYFNVDVANKAFPKPIPVLEVIKELCADRRGNQPRTVDARLINDNWDIIEKYLKGLKVIYQLPKMPSSKRTVGVNGLSESASKAVFALENGEQTTVQVYFQGAKRYTIQYPDLPTLWVGSRQKKNLVPMELCTIAPGLVLNGKLGEEQTRRMIRETATPAPQRRDKIMDSFRQMRYNDNPTMREFGISLSGEFEKVNARVLDPPALQYNRRVEQPRKGVWRAGVFLDARMIPENSWAILNLTRLDENALRPFADAIMRTGSQNGMNIGRPQTFKSMRAPGRDIRELQQWLESQKKGGIKLIVVIIPGFGVDVYPKVKQIAELTVGILTQCIKDSTVRKMVERNDQATTGNILLKINSKMNGINHTFTQNNRPKCLQCPVIIFGADVTHPSPDARDIPSIAAVAASHSDDVFKYNVDIRLQPPRQEIILQLEDIVYLQLKQYETNTGKKPEKIFFYRDGVSEGQFPQVMFYELTAIKNACKKLGGASKYQPKITFLVVQKRHHIRLFPADQRNSDDRGGNVQAGTIVDTQITHPSHVDFYLVSHASIQGTARPTKYRCLCDENDMSEDEIEQLTYYLCHMFSRCTRSVSYPAPTYYAHLAAFRARALTYGVNIPIHNLEQAQLRHLTLHRDLIKNSPMFFV